MTSNLIIVLSAPSGGGKTSVIKRLLACVPRSVVSVSVTTRPKRFNEIDGHDYRFTDHASFKAMIEGNAFLEYTEVFGNYYGTLRSDVESHIKKGFDIVFDIDWKGAHILRSEMPKNIITIFLLPPSAHDLKNRLFARNTEENRQQNTRFSGACEDLKHWSEYDYVLINDNLDETTAQIVNIINVEKLKRERQEGIASFVDQLCFDIQDLNYAISNFLSSSSLRGA